MVPELSQTAAFSFAGELGTADKNMAERWSSCHVLTAFPN